MIEFIDLCAGIGAGRLGLEKHGFKCVGFSEIDKKAINTYEAFHGKDDAFLGDLTSLDCDKIPDSDLLIAGFPCQTFSIVGKRKGFEDERGQIVFSISKILKQKNIKYFILENVKGLANINNGKTLKSIVKLLNDSGYNVFHKVLNSFDFGVPQLRERIYFVGIRKDLDVSRFNFPAEQHRLDYDLSEYLIENDDEFILNKNSKKFDTFERYLSNKYNKGKFNLSDLLKEDYLILDTRQSDLRLYDKKVPTLRTGRHGILYTRKGKLRYLSGKEALLLQGFHRDFLSKTKGISNTALLSQAGNAMTVNTIATIVEKLEPVIRLNDE
ncbi:MAG: DNA (cytosine-5-)-methyltransferase [Alphaproteobacteria bacterium]|nr:DNA (cytosine-5-)-methyltransferase [Alphaproteobacteria bacterium]